MIDLLSSVGRGKGGGDDDAEQNRIGPRPYRAEDKLDIFKYFYLSQKFEMVSISEYFQKWD